MAKNKKCMHCKGIYFSQNIKVLIYPNAGPKVGVSYINNRLDKINLRVLLAQNVLEPHFVKVNT